VARAGDFGWYRDRRAARMAMVITAWSERFDTVVTLCDRVREVCPEFASAPDLVHWSVADPSLEGATDRASYPAFERTAAELATRIGFGLPLLTHTTNARRPTHGQR